jgi:DnaJ-class molecular chaperone
MGKDFYSILDIDPETDKKEIRRAYIKLARRYHPDVTKDPDAGDRFQEINQAYSILSDDDSRYIYNLYYRGAQDNFNHQELLPWWKRYELAVSVSISALMILIWIGLLVLLVERF